MSNSPCPSYSSVMPAARSTPVPLSLTPAAATRVGMPLPKHRGATAIGYGPRERGEGGRGGGEGRRRGGRRGGGGVSEVACAYTHQHGRHVCVLYVYCSYLLLLVVNPVWCYRDTYYCASIHLHTIVSLCVCVCALWSLLLWLSLSPTVVPRKSSPPPPCWSWKKGLSG
jgi:hypothetical protein